MTVRAVYWDTSALLSALFNEEHSEEARRLAASPHLQLLSSLAWSEFHSALARALREQRLPAVLIDATEAAVQGGPWRHVNAAPRAEWTRSLARRWPLRGADLWHLALAKTLQADLPELGLVTFDEALAEAAVGEGLSLP